MNSYKLYLQKDTSFNYKSNQLEIDNEGFSTLFVKDYKSYIDFGLFYDKIKSLDSISNSDNKTFQIQNNRIYLSAGDFSSCECFYRKELLFNRNNYNFVFSLDKVLFDIIEKLNKKYHLDLVVFDNFGFFEFISDNKRVSTLEIKSDCENKNCDDIPFFNFYSDCKIDDFKLKDVSVYKTKDNSYIFEKNNIPPFSKELEFVKDDSYCEFCGALFDRKQIDYIKRNLSKDCKICCGDKNALGVFVVKIVDFENKYYIVSKEKRVFQ